LTPSRDRQRERIGPVFQRLKDVFDSDRDPLGLRDDPAGIAPERAIVFEVAGSIDDFGAAVAKIPGLEFLADEACIFDADDDFGIEETRKGKESGIRRDKPIAGRLYMAMPDVEALRQLLSLWRQFEDGEDAPRGFAPWFKVFEHLHDLRAWGPLDRIPDQTIAHLVEELRARGDVMIRVEIELWFAEKSKHERGQAGFKREVEAVEGKVIDQAEIAEIRYVGCLVDLPPTEVRRLIDRDNTNIVVCDDVMLVKPQSTIEFPVDTESLDDALPVPTAQVEQPSPVSAVFDAMPVQNHDLLEGRLVLDDPDDFDALSVVDNRKHGTEMASLVLHGDRNRNEEPLSRPIYFRPVMYAPGSGGNEQPLRNQLFLDVIYQAVLRMKIGDDEGGPTAPEVFIVNLSLGDRSRPFSGSMSPLGRLLDYLADRFNILFLVSAGNVNERLPVEDFAGLIAFEDATPSERQDCILKALDAQKDARTLLSPAEALNVVTVGAWHEDAVQESDDANYVFAPCPAGSGPNISSALGLGHRKVVKPDIFMPGGRERVRVVAIGEQGVELRPVLLGKLHGLRCAVPAAGGALSEEGLSAGTSAATALATRAAHRIFDALSDPDNGHLLDGVDPAFYGVIVKAMLVHRANWGPISDRVEQILQPLGSGAYVERRDRIARILGYGRPATDDVMACASNRATMIGHGEVQADGNADLYQIPLPPSLKQLPELRALTVSLAWFSPVNIGHQAYRRARLEALPENPKIRFGVERVREQPSDKSIPRGSLFHVRFEGKRAVDFMDDDTLALRVFCREQGGALDQSIRYGLAVTVEAGEAIQVYQEIRQALGVQVQG